MYLDENSGRMIREAIEKRINNEIERLSSSLSFNKLKRGIIQEINVNGYTIKIENSIYRNIKILEQNKEIKVGDVVEVIIPNNQYSQMFILGKLVNKI